MGRSSDGDGEPPGLSRAAFLRRAGAAGAVAMVPAGILAPAAAAATAPEPLHSLSEGQAATLEAVLERLIPTDATGPGAKEAMVLRYIDRALAGQLAVFKDPYFSGLAALDAYAGATRGGVFTALPPDQQDAILSEMEAGRATGFTPDAKSVFEMIRTHTLQGMFGDPAHGGNVNFVGWDLVRFPGPRLIIGAHDQKLDVTPKTVRRSVSDIKLFRKLDPKDS